MRVATQTRSDRLLVNLPERPPVLQGFLGRYLPALQVSKKFKPWRASSLCLSNGGKVER